MEKSHDSSDVVRTIATFVENAMPSLNCSCRDRVISLRSWTDAVEPIIPSAADVADVSDSEARRILHRAGGMLLLAAENHAQSRGFLPGEILTALPGLAEMLHAVAGAGRQPALSHNGYWLENIPPHRFAFTRSPSELFFIAAVQAQTSMRRASHELLEPVCNGAVEMASSQAARLISGATAAIEQGQLQFRDFYRGPDGNPGQTAAEFNEMRQWLPATRIASVSYGGPNAAYIPDMVGTDFLVGTADMQYAEYAGRVLHALDLRDRKALQRFTEQRSLIDVLSTELGFTDSTALGRADRADVARRLSQAPVGLRATAFGAKALHRAFCGSSGAHAGLIASHLETYAEQLTTEQLAKLAVSPSAGVGGHGHDHTRKIHDARRSNAAWLNLANALKMLPPMVPRSTKRAPVAVPCEVDCA